MDGGESPPVAGRFLKVLIPGFQTALKLPPPFSRMLNHTDLNSKTAVLKSCKGSWEIDIKKCDHGCLHFLGKSWEGYVSDHYLKEGDFIVFKHSGHLHFSTHLFDDTGCEKDFAFSESEEEESSSEDDVEQCFEDEHVKHIDEKDEEDNDVPIEDNYGSTTDQIANSSQFQLTVRKRNIENGSACVPKLFATSNDMMQNKIVKLRNATGDSWMAKLQVGNSAGGNKRSCKRVTFTGLSKFLSENKLETGDKCTLKLAQPSRSSQDQHFVMDVVFERRKREEHPSQLLKQDSKPQFEVTLTRWHLTHHFLHVPLSFARSNDMMRSTTVRLQNGTGDSWLVKLLASHIKRANKTCEQVVLTSLAEFTRDNDFKVGDTCIFKLVQPSTGPEDVVMDVVVLRKPQQSAV